MKNILIASITALLTLALLYISANHHLELYIMMLASLLVGCFVFFALVYQQKNQEKAILNHLYHNLPGINIDPNKVKSLKDISNQVKSLSLNKSSEIDILKKQENYRRDFIGNVSHELKTPLFSIQGFLLTLIEGGLEDDKIRDKYLNRINKSVERLIYIVRDLDLISELESGTLDLNQRKFNIKALCQEVFDLLELKALHNNINLQFDEEFNTNPIHVYGDIERIEQVLINLVANAINHASKSTNVVVGFKQENNQVKITVTDYGIGIKPEHLPRLFERFYRVDRSRSRQVGGSGLGLAIVKHILEAHNQKIFVSSDYDKGTIFWFYLATPNP